MVAVGGNKLQVCATGKTLQVGGNMKKIAKGRRAGENHQFAILTDGEVELVRQARESDPITWTYDKLVEKWEVSKSCIADICKYRRR